MGGRGWSVLAKPRNRRHRGFPSVQPRPPRRSVAAVNVFTFVCHGRVGRAILQSVLPHHTADTAVAYNQSTS